MFELDLKPLKNYPGKTESYFFNKEITPLETGADPLVFNGPVSVNVNLTNSGGEFILKGSVKGQIRLNCGRCLEDFLYPIDTEINEVYRPVFQTVDASGDDNGEDVITFKGDSIDITPELVKSVLVALPMKVVCDAHCKGLCPHCGSNLNKEKCNCVVEDIDPRLAVLKGFLKDDK